MLELLESRQLLAVSPVDTTWRFSQTEVDAAWGSHLSLGEVFDAGRGRTLVAGQTGNSANASLVVVALDHNGHLDPTFSDDGIANTGLPGRADRAKIITSQDGYIYVANDSGVLRLRWDGGRDRAFGGGRAVDFTGGRGAGDTLAMAINDQNGVDVVRARGNFIGAVGTPIGSFDQQTELVRVTGEGPRGKATRIWRRASTDGITGDNPDEIAPGIVAASVTPQVGGGWIVLTVRQRRAYYYPNSLDSDLSADVNVEWLAANGTVTNRRVFDIGRYANVSNINVHTRGQYVMFDYGSVGGRSLVFSRGRVSRQTLPFGPATAGLEGQQMTFHKEYDQRPTKTLYYDSVVLKDRAGRPVASFGEEGRFRLDDYKAPDDFISDFAVEAAHPGSALIGWTDYDRQKDGTHVDTRHLLRLWAGNEPTATMESATVRNRIATITVRYRAQAGIAERTVNSRDLSLRHPKFDYGDLRMIRRVRDGDSIVATYRSATLARGTYGVQVLANQIATVDDIVNRYYDMLGSFGVS